MTCVSVVMQGPVPVLVDKETIAHSQAVKDARPLMATHRHRRDR